MSRQAVRYYSMGDLSGYGIAAVGYVRGLVNAGVPVEWLRLQWPADGSFGSLRVLGIDCPLLEGVGSSRSGNFADLRALALRTSQPLECDAVICHTQPDYWPAVFGRAGGSRHVGITVWETDRPPAYWMPLLNLADRIVVPCRMNGHGFTHAGVLPPVRVVPHVRMHRAHTYAPAELGDLRRHLGIPPRHRVFYCIGAWDPRKAMPDLIDAYARAFRVDDGVTLLIKTGKSGYGEAPFHEPLATRAMFDALTKRLEQVRGSPLPPIRLIDGDMDDRSVGALHALGDCYVSLTHGEGWGLGAYDAATLGKPVIMTGWGAQLDYLAGSGGTWPGAVPYRLASAPVFPPQLPSFFPSQHWAQPDLDAAAALMRRFHEDGEEMRAAARAIRMEILNRFAEPVVTRQLLEAIDA